MQTTIFKVTFKDGREFRVFCANKNQINRFRSINWRTEQPKIDVITNGIHTIAQFEQILTNTK